GLLENAIYGCIDNEYDLRVLREYLRKYFNMRVLESKMSLVKGISIPSTTHYKDYVSVVNSLPDHDTPALFGLPPNADRLVKVNQGMKVVEKLKSLIISPDVGKQFDKEKWDSHLIPILQFWKNLTADRQQQLFHGAETRTSSTMDPIEAFISLELANACALCRFVDSALN